MARVSVLVVLLLAGCAGDGAAEPCWTKTQAESIATVRSLPVRVVGCEGLGAAEPGGEYARFDCVEGTRAAWESYDTIDVF